MLKLQHLVYESRLLLLLNLILHIFRKDTNIWNYSKAIWTEMENMHFNNTNYYNKLWELFTINLTVHGAVLVLWYEAQDCRLTVS